MIALFANNLYLRLCRSVSLNFGCFFVVVFVVSADECVHKCGFPGTALFACFVWFLLAAIDVARGATCVANTSNSKNIILSPRAFHVWLNIVGSNGRLCWWRDLVGLYLLIATRPHFFLKRLFYCEFGRFRYGCP